MAQYLASGEVLPSFREAADGPTLTSKAKRHVFGGLCEAYGMAFPSDAPCQPFNSPGPMRCPSYIAPSLIPKFCSSTGNHGLTDALVSAIHTIYEKFTSAGAGMTVDGVRNWLQAANGLHSNPQSVCRWAVFVDGGPDLDKQSCTPSSFDDFDHAATLSAVVSAWEDGYRSEFRHAVALLVRFTSCQDCFWG